MGPQDAAEARQETHLSWGRADARLFLRRLGVRKDRPHREDLSDGRVLFVGHGFPVPQVGGNKGLQKVKEEERKKVQGGGENQGQKRKEGEEREIGQVLRREAKEAQEIQVERHIRRCRRQEEKEERKERQVGEESRREGRKEEKRQEGKVCEGSRGKEIQERKETEIDEKAKF